MAAYRAIIQGTRGQASRLGGAQGGVTAVVNSWVTKVECRMCVKDGAAWVTVEASEVDGLRRRVLYAGPEADILKADK